MPANWWIGDNALAIRDPETAVLRIYDPDKWNEDLEDLDELATLL